MTLQIGAEVVFHPRKGSPRSAVITGRRKKNRKISVILSGDPFSHDVYIRQLRTKEGKPLPVAVTRKSAARELRRDAKNLRIRGWQDMTSSQLRRAIEDAKRANRKSAKSEDSEGMSVAKAKRIIAAAKGQRGRPSREVLAAREVLGIESPSAAKTKATKRSGTKPRNSRPKEKPAKRTTKRVSFKGDGTIPFRPGSNGYLITEELMKGGSRAAMVKRLQKKIEIHPWSKEKEEDPSKALDKRIILTAGILKNQHGWVDTRGGRGASGTIKVVPPSKAKSRTNGSGKVAKRTGKR